MATFDYMRKKNIKLYLLVFFGVLWWSCHSGHEDKLTSVDPPPVYFSKNWKAEMGIPLKNESVFRLQIIREINGNLISFQAVDTHLYQSKSVDNGKSWTQPRVLFTHREPVSPVIVNNRLLGVLTEEKVANGGQMYFQMRNEDAWDKPTPIRDTRWGNFNQQNFAADSSDNIYCVWTDWRQENPDIYFSVSPDGGKTWSDNVRIDNDQSGQEQQSPILLSTPGGILYSLWEDNRDPDTLFDIYFSSSLDGGITWSSAIKINDDTTFTWQIAPSAVLDKQGNLYVVWLDYRDKGAGGDVTPNIYFSRSDDGGISWCPNIRITDAQYGQNLYPKLHSEHDGSLYITWMNSEDNQQNDIYFSYSIDGGQSWSLPVRVNDDTERASHYHKAIGWLGFDSEKNGIVGWLDWRSGEHAVYFAKTLDQPDTTRPERDPVVGIITDYDQIISGIFEHIGDTLFYDDFTHGFSSLWEIQSGVWVCIDQTYIGYGAREASNFVGSESWNNYNLKGQFKLDKIAHQAAILYLRVNTEAKGSIRYYRIHNYFRRGVRVEYFDGRSLIPLADKPYPFQKDRWYTFQAAMRENVLNYYINDTLLLASEDLTQLSYGKVGIGAEYSPTYFKDIVVTAIR
jgi:hypothetical protein